VVLPYAHGELILAFTTLLGATSYVATKYLLEELSPSTICFYRFLLGFLCLVIVRPQAITTGVSKEALKGGAIIGTLMALSITLFFLGLRTTTPGLAAFLCNSEFLIIPFLELLLFGRIVSKETLQSILVGLSGVVLLMFSEPMSGSSQGHFYLLGASVGFSFVAIFSVRFTKIVPVYQLATVMMGVATVLSGAVAFTTSVLVLPSVKSLWFLLYLGVVITGVRFLLVLVAQRTVSAAHTGIIYLLEPVLATIFGVVIFSEVLTTIKSLGMLLMVISTLMIFRLKLRGDSVKA
jgi:drug/metabolite transporter (DMT)-like permease